MVIMAKQKWNTTVKLQDFQVEQIENLIKDKSLNYRSRSDFVVKAVEKEIRQATLTKELTDAGKIIFGDLIRHKRFEAWKESKLITEMPDSPERTGNKVQDKANKILFNKTIRKSFEAAKNYEKNAISDDAILDEE